MKISFSILLSGNPEIIDTQFPRKKLAGSLMSLKSNLRLFQDFQGLSWNKDNTVLKHGADLTKMKMLDEQ
ncbi:MAG TPA: hypothetical protein VJN71_04935 [Nitrososphaerales archaeon]|nr:hypothetical protein [Nitrososphaerales archaeon]